MTNRPGGRRTSALVIAHWSLVIGHWSFSGHWSLVIGHCFDPWSLVIGHSLVILLRSPLACSLSAFRLRERLHPDYRRKPAGAAGPPGLAGGVCAARCRLRSGGDLPPDARLYPAGGKAGRHPNLSPLD